MLTQVEDDYGDVDAYNFVMCNDCGACCSNLDTRPETECVDAWNQRATIPEIDNECSR